VLLVMVPAVLAEPVSACACGVGREREVATAEVTIRTRCRRFRIVRKHIDQGQSAPCRLPSEPDRRELPECSDYSRCRKAGQSIDGELNHRSNPRKQLINRQFNRRQVLQMGPTRRSSHGGYRQATETVLPGALRACTTRRQHASMHGNHAARKIPDSTTEPNGSGVLNAGRKGTTSREHCGSIGMVNRKLNAVTRDRLPLNALLTNLLKISHAIIRHPC
jgi:hypothetical protein